LSPPGAGGYGPGGQSEVTVGYAAPSIDRERGARYTVPTVSEAHARPKDLVDLDDVVGVGEIAEMVGVSTAAVANWRVRDRAFPEPLFVKKAGPFFSRRAVQRWLKRRHDKRTRKGTTMTKVIATINLKGGVGKTTTTVGLAEMYATAGNRVLVIDLDPQTNATVMLIDEQRWQQLDQDGQTLAQLFADALEVDPAKRVFDLDLALQKNVGTIEGLDGIDLIPSSLRLIDVQDKLSQMPQGQFFTKSPTQVLETAVKNILDDYDVVLIDCPPNMGIITLNGLRIADGYIIPTIPDVLSTFGIPQIQDRVESFADELNEHIKPYGIVVTKYRSASTLHINTIQALRDGADDGKNPPLFDTFVPEGNAIAAAAEFTGRGTLRQKYAYQGGYETFERLADEVADTAGF
jgi:chromosome partitioning protein